MVVHRDSNRSLHGSSSLALLHHKPMSVQPAQSVDFDGLTTPSPGGGDEALEAFTKKSKFRRSFKKGVGLLFGGNSGSKEKKSKWGASSFSVPSTPSSTPSSTPQLWRSLTPSFDDQPSTSETSQSQTSQLSSSRGPSPVASPSVRRRSVASNAFKAIFPRWKSRSKGVFTIWSPSPEENNKWMSLSGRSVVLEDIPLLELSEPERTALVRVALDRLAAMNVGSVTAPKGGSRRGLLKRGIALRKSKSTDRDKGSRDGSPVGLVFGQPLAKVLAHDKALVAQNRSSAISKMSSSFSTSSLPRSSVKDFSNSTSLSSLSDVLASPISGDEKASDDSPSKNIFDLRNGGDQAIHIVSFPATMTALVQSGIAAGDVAFNIDASRARMAFRSQRKNSAPEVFPHELDVRRKNVAEPVSVTSEARAKRLEKEQAYAPLSVQVPVIVSKSMRFLEEYGLHSTGLFRVPGSQKRIRQMKEECDAGKDVQFGSDLNPNDVAALLKTFLRDLPEPLLTRELYAPFIATRKLESNELRQKAMNLLCGLLPPANRDTLLELLKFLRGLADHSNCQCNLPSEDGQETGNKMDVVNLATVIGPNILHKLKSGQKDKEFAIIKQDQADDRDEVIAVVSDLIRHHQEMAKISPEIHHAMIKRLVVDEPEAADFLLKKKSILASGGDRRSSNDDEELYFCENHFSRDSRQVQSFRVRHQRHEQLKNGRPRNYSASYSSPETAESQVFCNPAVKNISLSGSRKKNWSSGSLNCDQEYDGSPLSGSPPPSSLSLSMTVRPSGSASDLKMERYSPRLGSFRSAPTTPARSYRNWPRPATSVMTTVTPATPESSRRPNSSRNMSPILRKVHAVDLRDSTEDLLVSPGSESPRSPSPFSPLSSHYLMVDEPDGQSDDKVDGMSSVTAFPWQNKDQLKDWGLQLQPGDVELLEQETLV